MYLFIGLLIIKIYKYIMIFIEYLINRYIIF